MATRPAQARLIIAGWGAEGDVAVLRALLAGLGDASIEFVGPVWGEAKQRLLETARFVVLPSFSEGLPMVVLEAWAAGTPTIMSEGCNLEEGFAGGAALRCGTDPVDIAQALEAGFALDKPGWLAMTQAAQGLARGPYSPAAIAHRWGEAYGALLAGARTAS